MGYTAISFSAGEQPTTAKWNLLGANDSSFNDGTGIGNGVITASKLATGAGTTTVAATEATTTTSYTDLTTPGPAKTVTIGANGLALVSITGIVFNGTTGTGASIGVAVSGANTISANDATALSFVNNSTTNSYAVQSSAVYLFTGLTPGSTTFTFKYRAAGGGTATYSNRTLVVVPL